MNRSPVDIRQEARFGIGFRREHFETLFQRQEGIDFLEILPENFMGFGGRPHRALEKALERWPVTMHAVSLNLGGLGPLDESFLDALWRFIQWVRPPWFTDHLSASGAHSVNYHDLVPLPFTREAVDHVVGRIRQVQARLGVPFGLENPSYYMKLPGAEMTEAEFINEVLHRADCGMLLDVNNVFVNATNHGYDARAFIDSLPAHRVLEVHMAGHEDLGDLLLDTHGRPVRDEVFDLYEYAVRRIGPRWTLLERDNDIPPVEVLLGEVARLRAIEAGARAGGRPREAAA